MSIKIIKCNQGYVRIVWYCIASSICNAVGMAKFLTDTSSKPELIMMILNLSIILSRIFQKFHLLFSKILNSYLIFLNVFIAIT